jgi:hypothetical protein
MSIGKIKKNLINTIIYFKDTELGRSLLRRSPNSYLNAQFKDKIIKNSSHATPDFVVVGTAKSGTTSIFQYLTQHPELVPPKKKEIKYFGKRDAYHSFKWYLSYFPLKEETNGKLTFEVESDYLYLNRSIPRIARFLPDIKLIAILRDPVKKAFSHWNDFRMADAGQGNMRASHQIEKRSFEEAVDEELNDPSKIWERFRYLAESRYSEQIRRCYKFFPPKQVLLLDFNELKTEPKSLLRKITDFLEIDPIYETFSQSKQKLYGHLFTKDKKAGSQIKHYNATPYKETLKKETEEKLRAYFASYDRELEDLTGQKFSWME